MWKLVFLFGDAPPLWHSLEPNANLFSHLPWLGNHRSWWRTAACQKQQEATRSCPHCATMGERGKQK